MEIQLKKESLNCCLPVISEIVHGEFSTEAVVPDTMPDIVRILDTVAAVYLRSRTMTDGRIALEGEIHGTVLYLGEDSDRIRKLDLRMPCTLSMEDESILESDRMTAELRLVSAVGRAVNPRKVELTAECAAAVTLYRETCIQIPTGAEDAEIQTLIQEQKIGYIASVQQKSFVVTEELTVPAAKPSIDTLLSYQIEAVVEEQKPVGGKIILQGNVHVGVQYLGTEGEPEQELFSVPFSQIIDMPEGVGGTSQIILLPDACYLETIQGTYGASSLHLETHLLAQAIFSAEREIPILTDVYSVHHPCTVKTNKAELAGALRTVSLRDTLRETMETADPPSEILFGRADVGLPMKKEDGIVLPVTIHVMCRNEQGQYSSVNRAAEMEFPMAGAEGENLVWESPISAEPYLTLSGGNVEFRLPLEIRGVLMELQQQDLICGVEMDEETDVRSPDAPSLTLVRLGEDTLWTLAKKYGSTEEMIRSVNPQAETGDILLIPRVR